VASEAEVDLIISTANALPELERDLQRIIRVAEDGAEQIDVEAGFEVQRTIAALEGQLNAIINAAEDDADSIELQAAIDRATNLRQINAELGEVIAIAQNNVDNIDIRAELDSVQSLLRTELQVRELVEEVEASTPPIEIEVDVDRNGKAAASAGRLSKALKGMILPITKVTGGIIGAGAAFGAAVPVMASTAAAVQQIAPAAALAVPSLLTLALTAGTVKLAMNGVGDAVKQAFDPETSPAELAESLKDLAPSARAFVLELQKMKKGLKDVQQSVQENFFKNFDSALKTLGEKTLPIFARAAQNTALTLNDMAHGTANAAVELGNNGTLGQALSSANIALLSLVKVPQQVVTALGQLAAAAGPTFQKLAASAGSAAAKISEKLSAAFESGALESSIARATRALAQFGRSIGNIFEGLGNIFSVVTQQGGGLFASLEKVTQAFADVTATKGFQDALRALVQTGSTLVATVLPLISTALQALGPVFQALGPPLELLVKALGDALKPVIEALSPVLTSLALAFGRLVGLITPFLKLASDLLVALLPALIPLFDALGATLNAMIPFAKQLAQNLAAQLVPLFTKLATEVLPKLLPPLVELSTKIFPILTDILVKLGPSLAKLGVAFADVLVALTPLLVQLTELTLKFVNDLMPVIQPIIDVLVKLIELGLGALVFQIANIVIPAIKILVELLRGDFHGAWEDTKDLVANVSAKVGDLVGAMKDKVVEQLRALAEQIGNKVIEIVNRLGNGFQEAVNIVRDKLNQLPTIVQGALAGAGTWLVNAGRDIVQGLISGITSQLSRLREVARQVGDVVSGSVKDFLGIHSPSRVMMEVGNNTMDGFLLGLQDRIPDLRKELQGVAALAPSFALPNGQVLSLPQASADAPVVQVFLGNELLNGHVDARISQSNQSRDRLATQGVRR